MSAGSTFSILADAFDDVVVQIGRDRQIRSASRAAVRLELGGALDGRSVGALSGGLAVLLKAGGAALTAALDKDTPGAFTATVDGVAYEGRVVPQGSGLARRTALVVARDRSAVQAVEGRLRDHDAHLRAVLDAVPDALLIGNEAGEIERVNQATERLFGYRDADLRGQRLQVLFDGPLGSPTAGHIGDATGAAPRSVFEAVGLRSDGTRVPCELLLTAYEAGGKRAYVGLIRDVSDWKAAGHALQASGDRHHALTRLIGAFAFEYRVENFGNAALDWVTDTVDAVLGFEPGQFLATTPDALVHPDDLPVWSEALTTAHAGGEQTVEVRVRTIDGAFRWLRLLAYAVADAGGRVARLHVAAQDVTAQKENADALVAARVRAEESGRLKDAFLASMSHEIRTPLTAILGFTDILRMEAPESMRSFIEPIETGGKRLMETLTALLELAQLRANAVTLNPGVVSIADVVADVLRQHRPAADAKGLLLAADVPPRLIVQLDRSALVRVLSNLVGNALKFSDTGGVAVIVRAERGRFVVRVRDTGRGIDPAFMPHLFEEFRQASDGLDRAYEGNGLGLAVAKLFVNLMGGTITARSVPGRGTEIDVHLPLGPHLPVYDAAPEALPRVLVVEDQEAMRRLVDGLLRGQARVQGVGTPVEALVAGAKSAYDVVLLDLDLGERLTGVELIGMLARMPWGAAARFVAMTGIVSTDADVAYLLDAGFHACLPKPFTREMLLAAAFPERTAAVADEAAALPSAPEG